MAQATVINVANPNNFAAGVTVATAAPGINGFGPFTGNVGTIVDSLAGGENQDDDFIFADGGQNDRVSLSGFGTHSGAVELRFFIAPEDGQRVPSAVTAYASTTQQTSTVVSDYTFLATESTPGSFTPYDPNEPTGSGRGYFNLSVLLPAGTQSLLVDFTPSVTGVRIYEIQALPVPEPATCVLLGIGAVGLVWAARRKSR